MLSNLNFFYYIIGFNPIMSIVLLENLIWFDSSYGLTMCGINNLIDKVINYIWCLFDLNDVIHDFDNKVELKHPDGSVEVIVFE